MELKHFDRLLCTLSVRHADTGEQTSATAIMGNLAMQEYVYCLKQLNRNTRNHTVIRATKKDYIGGEIYTIKYSAERAHMLYDIVYTYVFAEAEKQQDD